MGVPFRQKKLLLFAGFAAALMLSACGEKKEVYPPGSRGPVKETPKSTSTGTEGGKDAKDIPTDDKNVPSDSDEKPTQSFARGTQLEPGRSCRAFGRVPPVPTSMN